MAESFDAFRYIGYLGARWRWIGGACLVAGAIAFAASLAMPREYTATARIVIEPPAGTDARVALAVSPIYLESLKTYEQFAAGDSLFQKAIDRFGLRAMLGARPIESIKKRVLKVGLLRNTRVLEISATLPEPRRAQQLAQYLAESTVEANGALAAEGDREVLDGMERQERDLRDRIQRTDSAWSELVAQEPVTALRTENENAALLRSNLEQQISSTELEIAAAPQASMLRNPAQDPRFRLEQLRQQLDTLTRQTVEREKVLSTRLAHRDRLTSERGALLHELTAIETQLREARGGAAYRGERLKVIDPGIVPERPSSPNLPLNVGAALLLGLLLPVLWLTVRMSWQDQRAAGRRGEFQAWAKARDD